MKTTAKIMAVLLVLALAGSVSARVITVEVEGVVDYVATGGGFALDGSVIVGSAITGFCTYDTDEPDQNPFDHRGEYPLISISMSIGNYTFTHDPMSSISAFFEVSTVGNSYKAYSWDPRFDGTVYVNGTPKTFEDFSWSTFGLKLMYLNTTLDEYFPTDELPDVDSFPDLSIFDAEKFIGVGTDEGGPGFGIFGEITSLTVVPESAFTYYVDAAEGSDNNDGLSPQTPFATIQKAIDSALDGDTVLVADGTYTGPGNRDIDFLGKAITVRSESGSENCIIDCNGTETDPHLGFHLGGDSNSVLDGFTITKAYSGSDNISGAIFCDGDPTITNCIITGNRTRYLGAGISIDRGCSPIITNCIISNNIGRGIWCYHYSTPIISNCTITDNYTTDNGGFTTDDGGGIFSKGGWPKISNCIISGNSAANRGGGICFVGGDPRFTNRTTITNCTFSGNLAEAGGGIFFHLRNSGTSRPIKISNCTFAENSAFNGNALAFDLYYDQRYSSNVQLTNCILSDDGNEIWNNDDSNIAITYSNIQGGWPGIGNIDADPCFVEPGYWDVNDLWVDGDYYLLPDSLCIDAGDPNYIPEPNETDIDGNPRVINGQIDMGAYETNYIQAAMKFTPQMLNCNSKGKYVKAHITLPEGFLPQDADVNESAVAEPMDAYSESIKVLGAGTGPVRLEIAFDREAFCDGLTDTDDSLEITVIGSLTTSRYFYATDTIRIKPRR